MPMGVASEVAPRNLVYVPIIHTQADMGAFRDTVQRLKTRRLGRKGLERNLNLIDRLWTEIEKTIDQLPLSYEKVRLYQDGLPVCGREVEIVSDLARAGTRNHQLLLRLKERGATIMGTESSELLVEEYELIKGLLASRESVRTRNTAALQKGLSDSLLKRRDMYIAHRIDETLRANETGILFIGMLHRLTQWLAKDVRVTYPLNLGTLLP
jgi:DNA repair exonuclease SbcCD ATPase subunit